MFDTPSSKNHTRCIKGLIDHLLNSPESFPIIVEKYQTERQIAHYQLDEALIYSIRRDSYLEFNKILGNVLFSKYESFIEQRKSIKIWRDKVLAHNDNTSSVIEINYRNTNDLLDFGWMVVTIVGWAYLSTAYGHDGKNYQRDDMVQRGKSVRLTIERAISNSTMD